MLRRMRVHVPRGHFEERFVAQRDHQLGEHLAQRVDLPVKEHARVDRDPLVRGQVRRPDERVERPPAALQQVPEELLGLGEVHPRTSVSTSRARRLSSTTRSSSGM